MSEVEYNTGVESAFSILSQAIGNLQANDQTIRVGKQSGVAASTLFRTDICSVLNCIKQDTTSNILPTTYQLYKSAATGSIFPTQPAAVLSNGSYLQFNSSFSCAQAGVNACGYISVDINGSKGPNMFGKDYFRFWITLNNGVYSVFPFGSPGDGATCAVDGGWGCAYTRLTTPDNMPQ